MKKRSNSKTSSKKITNLIIRYTLLILVAIPNLWIFYYIFTPLTKYSVYFLLNLFFESASLIGDSIVIAGCPFPIEIIGACVGGSAYYLLLTLNLSTKGIEIKKRLKMILIAFLLFFLLNISRILILSFLFLYHSSFFDITHSIFWYALSTIFVVGIWFSEINFFKVKSIPFYSDLKFILKTFKH